MRLPRGGRLTAFTRKRHSVFEFPGACSCNSPKERAHNRPAPRGDAIHTRRVRCCSVLQRRHHACRGDRTFRCPTAVWSPCGGRWLDRFENVAGVRPSGVLLGRIMALGLFGERGAHARPSVARP